MKILRFLLILVLPMVLIMGCQKLDSVQDEDLTLKGAAVTGNGAPSGPHYNLNIIGVSNTRNFQVPSNDAGHVIFVPISGRTNILLQEGVEFKDLAVIDKNAVDGEGMFQLPPPGYDPYVIGVNPSPTTTYSVYIRSLGSPKDEPFANIATCADLVDEAGLFALLPKSDKNVIINLIDNDPDGLGGYISVEQIGQEITKRTKGQSLFTNVTAQLTSIVFQIEVWDDMDTPDPDDDVLLATYFVRVPIFSDLITNEYWMYDNHGLKLLQVRFYPTGTNLSDADKHWQPIIP